MSDLYERSFKSDHTESAVDLDHDVEEAEYQPANTALEFAELKTIAADLSLRTTDGAVGGLSRLSSDVIARISKIPTKCVYKGLVMDKHERHWNGDLHAVEISYMCYSIFELAERRLASFSTEDAVTKELYNHFYRSAILALGRASGAVISPTVNLFNEASYIKSHQTQPELGFLNYAYYPSTGFLLSTWYGSVESVHVGETYSGYYKGILELATYLFDVAEDCVAIGRASSLYVEIETLSAENEDEVAYLLEVDRRGLMDKLPAAERLLTEKIGVVNSELVGMWYNRMLSPDLLLNQEEFPEAMEMATDELCSMFNGAIVAHMLNMETETTKLNEAANLYVSFECQYAAKTRDIELSKVEPSMASLLFNDIDKYWHKTSHYTTLFVQSLEKNNIDVIANTKYGDASTAGAFMDFGTWDDESDQEAVSPTPTKSTDGVVPPTPTPKGNTTMAKSIDNEAYVAEQAHVRSMLGCTTKCLDILNIGVEQYYTNDAADGETLVFVINGVVLKQEPDEFVTDGYGNIVAALTETGIEFSDTSYVAQVTKWMILNRPTKAVRVGEELMISRNGYWTTSNSAPNWYETTTYLDMAKRSIDSNNWKTNHIPGQDSGVERYFDAESWELSTYHGKLTSTTELGAVPKLTDHLSYLAQCSAHGLKMRDNAKAYRIANALFLDSDVTVGAMDCPHSTMPLSELMRPNKDTVLTDVLALETKLEYDFRSMVINKREVYILRCAEAELDDVLSVVSLVAAKNELINEDGQFGYEQYVLDLKAQLVSNTDNWLYVGMLQGTELGKSVADIGIINIPNSPLPPQLDEVVEEEVVVTTPVVEEEPDLSFGFEMDMTEPVEDVVTPTSAQGLSLFDRAMKNEDYHIDFGLGTDCTAEDVVDAADMLDSTPTPPAMEVMAKHQELLTNTVTEELDNAIASLDEAEQEVIEEEVDERDEEQMFMDKINPVANSAGNWAITTDTLSVTKWDDRVVPCTLDTLKDTEDTSISRASLGLHLDNPVKLNDPMVFGSSYMELVTKAIFGSWTTLTTIDPANLGTIDVHGVEMLAIRSTDACIAPMIEHFNREAPVIISGIFGGVASDDLWFVAMVDGSGSAGKPRVYLANLWMAVECTNDYISVRDAAWTVIRKARADAEIAKVATPVVATTIEAAVVAVDTAAVEVATEEGYEVGECLSVGTASVVTDLVNSKTDTADDYVAITEAIEELQNHRSGLTPLEKSLNAIKVLSRNNGEEGHTTHLSKPLERVWSRHIAKEIRDITTATFGFPIVTVESPLIRFSELEDLIETAKFPDSNYSVDTIELFKYRLADALADMIYSTKAVASGTSYQVTFNRDIVVVGYPDTIASLGFIPGIHTTSSLYDLPMNLINDHLTDPTTPTYMVGTDGLEVRLWLDNDTMALS